MKRINNICFLKHSYMFRYLYIILREPFIMYTKVSKIHKLVTFLQVIVAENQYIKTFKTS